MLSVMMVVFHPVVAFVVCVCLGGGVGAGVLANPHLKLVGKPELSVVCFDTQGPGLTVYGVADGMKARGWNLNLLQVCVCAVSARVVWVCVAMLVGATGMACAACEGTVCIGHCASLVRLCCPVPSV
jgi:hypothetical protein